VLGTKAEQEAIVASSARDVIFMVLSVDVGRKPLCL
jgi:hypothetical protein